MTFTFVMDVDGTLCPIKKPNQEYSDLPCYPEMRDRLRMMKEQGAKIVLYSSRQMRTYNGDIEAIERYTRPVLEKWLAEHEIPYDSLILGKPWAGVRGYYVDDRAMLPQEFMTWKPSTLIVPICGRSSRYPKGKPKYLYPIGNKSMIEEALSGVNLRLFSHKVFVVLREHEEQYRVSDTIFSFVPDAEIVLLDAYTSCQSETVAVAIRIAGIEGNICIRDCDNRIDIPHIQFGNAVAGYELRYNDNPVSHSNKCFLVLDGKNVKRIEEKNPVSSVIGCGLYSFASASEFVDAYEHIDKDGEVYISDVISKMIADGTEFAYMQSISFIDWGTIDDYNREQGL